MKQREIKFRTWDTKLKKMFYFPVCSNVADTYPSISTYDAERNIMQYTGLKDKKGVEIYGGDCFSINNRETGTRIGMAWVVWDENELGFRLTDNMKCGEKNIHWFAKNREVIGNIYESPQLLDNTDTKE